jgi:peptidoglycan hydrolase-like protein with peptidoglycan-binding domain
MLKINKQYLPEGHHNRPGNPMDPEGIIYHTTNNWNDKADDVMHGKYMASTSNTVSWHSTVDYDSATEHLPTVENGWHAGDGGKGHYNRNWVGVEISCNRVDRGQKLDKETYDNAVEYVAHIMQELGLNHWDQLQPHNVVYGKDCPHHTLFDRNQFKRDVFAVLEGEQQVEVVEKEEKRLVTNPQVKTEIVINLIKFNDRGEDVKRLQADLRYLGENCSPDGIFGPITLAAVRNFQRKHGLVVDGLVGPKTRAKLKEVLANPKRESIPYPGRIFKLTTPYMKDEKIKLIQEALGLKEDGIYGPITTNAVKEYQRLHGLKIDGVVGPKTWNKMF